MQILGKVIFEQITIVGYFADSILLYTVKKERPEIPDLS